MTMGEIIFLVCFLFYLASIVLCGVIYTRKDLNMGFWSIFFLVCPILNTVVAIRHRKYLYIKESLNEFLSELEDKDGYN